MRLVPTNPLSWTIVLASGLGWSALLGFASGLRLVSSRLVRLLQLARTETGTDPLIHLDDTIRYDSLRDGFDCA